MTNETDLDEPEELVTVEHFEIFDAQGKIRTDIPAEIINGLPPHKREQWFLLAAEAEKLDASEEALRLAIKHSHACANAASEANNNLIKARPIITRQAAAQAVILAQRTGRSAPVDPATAKAIRIATAALEKAEATLSAAHRDYHEKKEAVERARITFFAALVKWNEIAGPKPTQKDLVKQVAATQPARDADAAKHTAAEPPSRIDALMRNTRGKVGRSLEHPNKSRIPSLKALRPSADHFRPPS
jgi:hypothetical protein